jgi:multidrug resistance efflux pump
MTSGTRVTPQKANQTVLPLLILIGIGGICILLFAANSGPPQDKAPFLQVQPSVITPQIVAPPPPTAAAPVSKAPEKSTPALVQGRVIASKEIEIKSKINGVIRRIMADVGDTVQQGDLLVELDTADALIQVQRAEASLAASTLRCEQARKYLLMAQMTVQAQNARAQNYIKSASARAARSRCRADRIKDAMKRSAASQEESDEAETGAAESAANLKVNEIQLDDVKTQEVALDVRRQDVSCAEVQLTLDNITLQDARQRLADTKILAPMSGVVTARSIQPGQFVATGTNTAESAFLTVSDLSRLCVLARVPVGQIATIKIGQAVAIHATALCDKLFQGRVASIAPCGTSNGADVTVCVKIEILDEQVLPLKPELQVGVEFK